MKVQINRDLIRLIEKYAGSLDAFSDIENISLYMTYQYMVTTQMNCYQNIRLYSMFL